MLALCQAPIVAKPCIKKPEPIKCAVRHRRCPGCPFDSFFKPENPLKYIPPDTDNKKDDIQEND